ncbi:hypothetical protein [Streptomyces sp. NPDC058773]|uniref:hypothetical protein n=1 Tax=Streptomyces sp. NPDC058773 TaxID=3346632 RepID=UPI0036B12299
MSTPPQLPDGYGPMPGYGVPQGVPQQGPPPVGYPVGGTPAGPTPYGQQPGPYGMPQQAPQFGYGGGPGMPPLPPKRKAAKAFGILGAIAGVLVIGTVASTGVFRGGGSSSGGSDSGPRYRITVPQTLADGEYKLAKDISQQATETVGEGGANEHNVTTSGGQYSSGTKMLVMVGIYGVIDDPQTAIDHSIEGMKDDSDTEVAVADKKFTPSRGGESVTCGVDVRTEMGKKVTLTFCVWADSTTSGNVAESDSAELAKDPRSIDLQAFADKTDKIRSEVRKPVG